MSRNGSGVYTLPANSWNPAVDDTEIDANDWNDTGSDLETALTNSIACNGETTITANIPMNGHKLTGLGAATASGDALSYGGAIGPRFRVYRGTSNQTGIASITPTTIIYNAATYDVATLVNLTSGVMTCNLAGVWLFSAAALVTGTFPAGTFASLSIYKNGTIYSTNETLCTTAAGIANLSCDVVLAASDTAEIKLSVQTSSGTSTVTFASADTWWNGRWCGA